MRASLEDILNATLKGLEIGEEEFEAIKSTRLANAIRIRQIVAFLGQQYGYTLVEIGTFLNVTHSTALHASNMAKDFYAYEEEYTNKVDDIMAYLNEVQTTCRVKGWIARDTNGSLNFFEGEMPIKNNGVYLSNGTLYKITGDENFPQITINDPPQKCEITIRLK